MPRRAPVGAPKAAKTVRREPPPPGAVLIPGIYERLAELARERLANGDPDPRCALDGSEDPDRHEPDRRGNVAARADLAALASGGNVTVPFRTMMAANESTILPLFPRGTRRFHVAPDGYVWPAT